MYKRWFIALCSMLIIPSGMNTPRVYGLGSSVVIAQVQAGADSSEVQAATKEFISLYNNGDTDVDITGWCLTNKSKVSFACFTPPTAGEGLVLPSHGYATMSSGNFADAYAYTPDVAYPVANNVSGNIVGSSDTITLIGADGTTVDQVSWKTSLAGGSMIERSPDVDAVNRLVDTDADTDFHTSNTLIIPPSSVVERAIVLTDDTCPNLEGVQETLPGGYALDEVSNCVIDVCQNISGIQGTLPDDQEIDSDGACVAVDVCPNIINNQASIPDGYEAIDGLCVLLPVKITELLPNPVGNDSGSEFIEFYNPNDKKIDLSLYTLQVGSDNMKAYTFPANSFIEPESYRVFMNSEIAFTLVNTVSKVSLIGSSGVVIDESIPYDNPADGMAWASVDGIWQYTNQLTPGGENKISVMPIIMAQQAASNVVACASNQYRSPDTNRCRLTPTVVQPALTPCKVGQYRNEETNRCRSIVVDSGVLGACADNQERNPDTNRCRLIATSTGSTATPCKQGQERNLDTNRCRTIVKIAQAGYPVEPVAVNTSGSTTAWLVAGGIGIGVVAYGIWEWRQELTKLLKRLSVALHSK